MGAKPANVSVCSEGAAEALAKQAQAQRGKRVTEALMALKLRSDEIQEKALSRVKENFGHWHHQVGNNQTTNEASSYYDFFVQCTASPMHH